MGARNLISSNVEQITVKLTALSMPRVWHTLQACFSIERMHQQRTKPQRPRSRHTWAHFLDFGVAGGQAVVHPGEHVVPGQVVGRHAGAVHVHRHSEIKKELIEGCKHGAIRKQWPLLRYQVLMMRVALIMNAWTGKWIQNLCWGTGTAGNKPKL